MNITLKNRVTSTFIPLFLISVSLLLAYSNSFNSPFYFDDYGYVVGNSHIELTSLSFENLRDAALKSPIPKRILPNISFALNHYFLGADTFGFHIVNLILHLLTALAVFYLFKTILTLPKFQKTVTLPHEIALVAALLWACHPLQTNAVTYVVQRMTCMATLFTITALLCYLRGRIVQKQNLRNALGWWLGCFVFSVMALISKENSAMLPLLIIAVEFYFVTEIHWKKDYKKIISILVPCLALLLLLAYVYLNGNLTSFLNYSSRSFTLEERVLTEMRVVLLYLSLFFLPLPSRLTLFHDISLSQSIFNPPQTLFSLLLLILFAVGIIFFFKRARLLSFAFFWFFINLVIESSVIPLEIIYEHRTYLPTIFFPLVLVVFLYSRVQQPYIRRGVATVLTCLLIFFTWQRNTHWSDSALFWQDAAIKAPNISRTHMGSYFALKSRGKNQEAFESLKMAFDVDPGNKKAVTPLVKAYNEKKQFSTSLSLLNKHLSIKETVEGYLERAKVYALLKNMPQTYEDAEKALQLNPKSSLAMLVKGKALTALGRQKEALEAFSAAQKNGLDSAILYISIGEVYINSGRPELAIHYFKKGLDKDPNNASGHYYLGLAYGKVGKKKEAQKEMSLGLKLKANPVQQTKNPHNF